MSRSNTGASASPSRGARTVGGKRRASGSVDDAEKQPPPPAVRCASENAAPAAPPTENAAPPTENAAPSASMALVATIDDALTPELDHAMHNALSDDEAAFVLASRWRASWLCAKTRNAATNADVVTLVHRVVCAPLLFVAGGEDVEGETLSSVFEFNVGAAESEQRWRRCADLPSPLSAHACLALPEQRQLLTVGGCDNGVCRSAFLYHRRMDEWRSGPLLPSGRALAGAAWCGRARATVVAGGMGWEDRSLASDPVWLLRDAVHADAPWSRCARMHVARRSFAFSSLGSGALASGLLAAGGWSAFNQQLASTECFDAVANRWRGCAPLPSERANTRGVAVGRSIVVIGGNACDGVNGDDVGVLRLDERDGEWRPLAALPSPTHLPAACSLDETAVLVLGGYPNGTPSVLPCATCVVYETRTDRWRVEPRWQLPQPLRAHTAAVLV